MPLPPLATVLMHFNKEDMHKNPLVERRQGCEAETIFTPKVFCLTSMALSV